MSRRWKKLIAIVAALAVAAGLTLLLQPAPVPIEAGTITVGPLSVTVEDDGETRAQDRFVVSAPVAGRVTRIELHEGDQVARDQVVAELWPLPLSARERQEQLARIAAAEASLRAAQEQARRAQANHEQARRESLRMQKLVAGGFVSRQEAEQARVAETISAHELEAARFRVRSAEADLKSARSVLLALDGARARIPVRSPIAGKILRIPEKSERVVAAATPLIIIGDPKNLEVVIDLLSTDAVKVSAGMPVLLEGWGGDQPLRARVRVVEPYGFTKISALGVEEQRVNIIADFVDPPGPLGDGYRVEAKIIVWSNESTLKIPVSALFRRAETWAVFVIENGRARIREVRIGQRGTLEAEVLEGLRENETVIRHPSNDISDGTRVRIS